MSKFYIESLTTNNIRLKNNLTSTTFNFDNFKLSFSILNSFKKAFKFFLIVFICLLMLFGLYSCNIYETEKYCSQDSFLKKVNEQSIVILYTNDIHGSALYSQDCLGFDGLEQLKATTLQKTSNVILADAGDSYQGNYMCAKSKGEYIVNLMNHVGYDVTSLGNHEFDYGLDNVLNYAKKNSYSTLCCNFKYTGINHEISEKMNTIKPYKIINGVGFIGVDTPEVIEDAEPGKFDEGGKCVYDMCQGNPQALYSIVQNNIDECKNNGANKIVILSHLGDYAKNQSDFSSDMLAKNICNCDVIIDAHTHSEINANYIMDKTEKEIPVVSSGALFKNIGAVVIQPDESINTYLIDDINGSSNSTTDYINSLKRAIDPEYDNVLTKSNYYLEYKGYGNMLNSSREDELGNLLADSFKYTANANCGIINATSYRAHLPQGDITKENLIDLLPFKDEVKCVTMSGADIKEMLEKSCCKIKSDYEDENGNPVGSNANFLQVSGIKFDVDVSVPTSLDGSTDRVKNIMIQTSEDSYEPIFMTSYYTVGTSSYLAGGGCGMTMFKNCSNTDTGVMDDEAVLKFISHLNNDIKSCYSHIQERINIVTG